MVFTDSWSLARVWLYFRQSGTFVNILFALLILTYQKIYNNWNIHFDQFRSFDVSSSGVETATLLARAMSHLLNDRQALFKLVIDEYCTSRRASLARAFIDALTVGGPGGTPRPIEWHAHDPQRYVGDMLAWLHQATPSENENIHALLKFCPDNKQDFGKNYSVHFSLDVHVSR